MIRDQFEALTNLQVALSSVFYDQLTAINEPGSDLFQFFNMQTTSRAAERNQGVGGFSDVPEYDGTLEYDSFELLYQKEYVPREFAKGVSVERKLIDDDEYGVMSERIRLMGLSFDRTRYNDAAAVFNNAFSTSYTRMGKTIASVGGDAVALCSASHPRSPSQATSLQSNAGSSALSHDSVVATRKAMMKLTNSKGYPVGVIPDTLVVPVDLMDEALVITGSDQRSGNANNDNNTLNGLRVVTSLYLSDTNNWFMLDSRMARMWLKWYDRIMPEFTLDPTSDYKLRANFRGYMRYDVGWDRWEWIYGHAVS